MNAIRRCSPVMLATAVLPWDRDYRFLEGLFREQVRLLAGQLTPYLYVFGTAGEGYAVSDQQFQDVVRAFHQEMVACHAHPMVGVISLSTETVVQRIAWCYELGIRDFQISLPCWAELTDREVDIYFDRVCGGFPDARFLHYNLLRSRRILFGADYARLAARHPNLVSAKIGGSLNATQLTELFTQAPNMQFFLTEFAYASVRDTTECGYLVSLGMVNLELARAFYQARGARLTQLTQDMRQILSAVQTVVGDQGHIDGAFDKMFTKLHLPLFPLRLLPPYTSASEDCIATFRDRLPDAWR